ncbi:VanW-like protein [Leptospira yanagawae serovar Saopaulo str. Sao Paulo = ATCC 700523]|uniref:VanW-like protein n=1 Tax=Leptospira yanagawae serovar Saopaulo str. Sao Paulo = ATCC 700523 TaxID=1249483 RepID=A0A5E8HLA8_9LEPT|nr:VanW family protein [Leptospira yanagawae]EOQ90586.1 VanW-like protein [Leptospira yanagawae serovar Saopaulo str. Sao Paulo = ATCC 700523]
MISNLKLKLKYMIRLVAAITSGAYFQYGLVKQTLFKTQDTCKTSLSLPILPSPLKTGKMQNLKIAIEKINEQVLLPGKIFSFWTEIGNPTVKKGYTEGRVIRNGVVASEIAGGLCQLSGIIYYLSLELGLEILERFPHTRDLYTEETRFTPLGTDASVVFPSKDLRIRNNLSFPLQFSFELTDDMLTFQILSPKPLQRHKLHFQKEIKNGYSKVSVYLESDVHGELKLCSSDEYQF